VSVGFRPPTPSTPPIEHVLLIVRKDNREARALVRQHPHGRELVVMVGQDVGWSRLYKDHEDGLGEMAEGCRLNFERLGWRTDTSS
jgi:hypothetical protein